MEESIYPNCPHCGQTTHQQKVGQTPSGSQRYQCAQRQRKDTLRLHQQGYAQAVRQQAIERYSAMSMG